MKALSVGPQPVVKRGRDWRVRVETVHPEVGFPYQEEFWTFHPSRALRRHVRDRDERRHQPREHRQSNYKLRARKYGRATSKVANK